MRALALCLLLACIALPLGCSGGEKPTLTVYVAAGLRPPVAEFIEAYSRREGIKIETLYSGSGVLLSQIELAKRGDVYLAGDQFFMKQAVDKGLVLRQSDIAWWVPVIAVRKGNPKGIKGLADLSRADLKVGLGDAKACAVGRSSAAMLARAGLADKVKPVFTAPTVNEIGNHLQLGTIDAAILWDAVAKFYPDDVDAVPIEPEWREDVSIPAAVLKSTQNEAMASKFVDALCGEEGRGYFTKHGYTVSRGTKEGR